MPNDEVITKKVLHDSEMHRVLELALEAGRVLLRNGAEIFRVEETIEHICNHFGVKEMDAFVLSNGIFLTAHDEGKEIFAKVKSIPLAGTNLEIVTEVNELSREISAGLIGVEDAFERLKEIEALPPKKDRQLVFAAGIGCGVFCYLTKGTVYESIITCIIAGIAYYLILIARRQRISKIIINLIGGGLVTLLAYLAVQIPFPFTLSLDKIIIGCIFCMIPGVAFVNAIRDVVNNDFISGTVKMLDALMVFVYIAIGVGFVLSLVGGGGLL